MKRFLLVLLLFLPLVCYCQTDEGKYYLYNIFSCDGRITAEGIAIYVDNGQEVKRLRDENGDKIKFKTSAGAFMYLISKGWELYSNGSNTEGGMVNGIGATQTSPYWIMRKPCTKEEFEKTVGESIKK